VKRSRPYNRPAAAILKALWVYSYAILLAIFGVFRHFEKMGPRIK